MPQTNKTPFFVCADSEEEAIKRVAESGTNLKIVPEDKNFKVWITVEEVTSQ